MRNTIQRIYIWMIIALIVLTGVLEKPQGIYAAEEVKTEEEIIKGI